MDITDKYTDFELIKENYPMVTKFLMKMNHHLPSWTVHDYQIDYCEMLEEAHRENKNGLIAMPTGMGKTMALFYALLLGRVIYVTPSVALTNEKYTEISQNFPNYTVLRDTGADREARRKNPELFTYEETDVIVTTNERLLYMINGPDRDRIFDEIDYIVFDEIHKISDISRGANLEYVLMLIKKEFPMKQIIGLSATLPNYMEFGNWLDARFYYRPPEDRPVRLIPFYADPVPRHYRKAEDKRKYKFQQLKSYTKNMDGQFLVFMNSKPSITHFSEEMAKFRGATGTSFEEMMEVGVATHYRGMSEKDQLKVIELFNARALDIIFCTTTLAEGVNTSATNCVIFDFSFWNKLASMHEYNEYDQITQIMGRAGRPGMGIEYGRAIFMGASDELRQAEFYVNNPQNADSQFGRVIVDKILNMIAMKYGNTVDEINEVIKQSFLIYQLRDTVNSIKLIKDAIALLLKYELIREQSSERYFTTKEGYLTTTNALKVHSVIDFLHNLNKVDFKPTNYYDVYRVFLSTEDILSPINYNERKDKKDVLYTKNFFTHNDNRKLINYDLLINVYDKHFNGHVLVDHNKELWKYITQVFNKDLNGKLHFSAGSELDIHKQKSYDHITRMLFIFKDKIKAKGFTDDFINESAYAMKFGSLDKRVIELAQIKGIGVKTVDKLLNMKIDSVKKLVNTPYKKLKRAGIRIGEKKLMKIAEDFGFNTSLNDFF